jgi:hypothetical protein
MAYHHRNSSLHALVRFDVLTFMTMKITISWDVTSCSLVDIQAGFSGTFVNI